MLRLLPFFYWVSRVGVDGLGFLGPLISVLHAKCINHFGGAQKTSGKMDKMDKNEGYSDGCNCHLVCGNVVDIFIA